MPRRVLVTPAALAWDAGRAAADRAVAGLPGAYRDAKTTVALVTASPSRRRLQPIPPTGRESPPLALTPLPFAA